MLGATYSPAGGQRVLAIRAGALGDTILTFPAIAALAAPGNCVELVGTLPYTELAKTPGLAHDVHSIDRAWFRAFFDARAEDGDLLAFLEAFDLIVAWARLPLLGVKARRLQLRYVEASPNPPEAVHASDHLMSSVRALGFQAPKQPPELRFGDPSPLLDRYDLTPASFVAIHPSSGSPKKNWPPYWFAEFARCARAAGQDLLWVQGEADHDVVSSLARAVPGPVAAELPLRDLATLLAFSAVFIGHDSGVSHLAAAAGAPTLALFLATDPRQWAPRGPSVRVVEAWASPEAVWGFTSGLKDRRNSRKINA